MQQARGPAIFAFSKGLLALCQRGIFASQRLYPLLRLFHLGQSVVVSRDGVPPAEIALVNRLRIVFESAVISARPEIIARKVGLADLFGNFVHGQPLIGHTQRLVMDITIDIALVAQPLANHLRSPARPVVGGKNDIAFAAVPGQYFVNPPAPCQRIAHQRAARGQDVVKCAGDNLCRMERAKLRQIEHEF